MAVISLHLVDFCLFVFQCTIILTCCTFKAAWIYIFILQNRNIFQLDVFHCLSDHCFHFQQTNKKLGQPTHPVLAVKVGWLLAGEYSGAFNSIRHFSQELVETKNRDKRKVNHQVIATQMNMSSINDVTDGHWFSKRHIWLWWHVSTGLEPLPTYACSTNTWHSWAFCSVISKLINMAACLETYSFITKLLNWNLFQRYFRRDMSNVVGESVFILTQQQLDMSHFVLTWLMLWKAVFAQV